jgi:hypothetical protein
LLRQCSAFRLPPDPVHTEPASNDSEAGFHTVVVSIPKALAPGGRLFARLKVAVMSTP